MSEAPGTIAPMFDSQFRGAADTAVLEAIGQAAQAESAAAARKLAAIAELVDRRCSDGHRADWACDDWDAAAAEISAVLGISHGRASGQMQLAVSLVRLPRVAALFRAGRLTARVVAAIVWRTDLVTDDDAMALIDQAVAERAGTWNALSQYKLEQAIDTWIDRHDPGALRRTQSCARSRDVTIGAENHQSGTASLWGRLYATDAAVLERKLSQMAHGVCEDDPRTVAQRRADALGALGAGAQHLACQCGGADCSAADPRAGSVVIHVLADQQAVAAGTDPAGADGSAQASRNARPGSAVIVGGGVLPAPLLAELIRGGAKVRYLCAPVAAEPQYRPSAALDEFIRARDLTCRFPHCDVPAEQCDIDHAIPWPFGPTHACNLRCQCRKHHLLKTFWTGSAGWSDEQFADGTIVWTAPTGKTYLTRPGATLLFPDWDPCVPVVPATTAPRAVQRGLMMPLRRRTRVCARRQRIQRERALNDSHVAERTRPPPF